LLRPFNGIEKVRVDVIVSVSRIKDPSSHRHTHIHTNAPTLAKVPLKLLFDAQKCENAEFSEADCLFAADEVVARTGRD
jgi:hypothetical protein